MLRRTPRQHQNQHRRNSQLGHAFILRKSASDSSRNWSDCEKRLTLTPALSHPMGEGEVVPALGEIAVVWFRGSESIRTGETPLPLIHLGR
jgi:hypothetical protein